MVVLRKILFWSVLSSSMVLRLTAQHEHSGPSSPGAALLLPGMGNHHHPISTRSDEAQKFFDQGLTLVYGFNHEEAVRSFRRAAELDPAAPMPHWGIALALGPNINLDVSPEAEKAAYDAVQKAISLAANGSEAERSYIDALSKRYSNDPKADLKKIAVDYKNAMGELVKSYPDDLDAAALYAESLMDLRPWRLWTADGKPEEGTLEIVAVLESVLRRDPAHVGANHYYIHAVEASPAPARALPSAERLTTLVPGAGHLVHMPGHIYLRTGDYEAAARTNEHAAEADRRYMAASGVQTGFYPLMYYSHNIHFIAVARASEGRYRDSKVAADQLAETVLPGVKEMPMVEGFLTVPWFVLLRFNKWDEILALPAPDPALAITNLVRRYARTIALAARGRKQDAEREYGLFSADRKQVPPDAPFGPNNTAAGVLAVAGEILQARLSSNAGEAIEHWKKAVAAQQALVYDEPPPWYYPVRESLGAALLRAERPAEAEEVFREDLRENPRNGRSLFGLMKSLEAQKREADAFWVRRQFQEAWKNADIELHLEDL